MKKIVISTLAVLIACPAFAGTHKQDSDWQMFGLNPYIALRGGLGYTNLNYSFNDRKESMTDMDFQGRAALGLEICDTVRSEVEWSIFSKAKDNDTFGTSTQVDIDAKLQTLLVNSYWEFGGYQIVRPFVGLGVGAAFSEVTRKIPAVADHHQSRGSVAAMGTLGMTFDMDYFAVDVAARYTYADVNSGLHNFGGDVGIRFMF